MATGTINMDVEKSRREILRWRVLQTLQVGRPYPVGEDVILATVGGEDMPITPHNVRRSLDYLATRDLVKISGRETGVWSATLTRYGIDFVDYTIDAEPGIARPRKVW